MDKFPGKTCDISRLVTHPRLVAAILAGKKSEQRRNGVYAYPGEEFELEGVIFAVTSLRQQALGEMSDADALAEGYPSLEMYKGLILSMHKGMQWNVDDLVWVHGFKRKA